MIASLLAALLATAPTARLDCAAALRIELPGARVTAATPVAGDSIGPKPYCRVEAAIDAETHIVALLPDEWNGRFLMGGAGGFVGAVQNQVEGSVHQGYATAGTDAGHSGFAGSAEWALGHQQRVIDYGHRAVHRSAEVTKALITAYYGRPAEHSYFIGCSNGGRQALMEAQRYPDDFDGIVAIAPAYNFLTLTTAFLRNLQAQYPSGRPDQPVVTTAVLRLVASKVTEACDAIDGVRDGVLENPDACGFKFASLPACPNEVAADNCVTRAQRAALVTLTTPLAAGTQHYPGWPLAGMEAVEGWETWITGPLPAAVQMSAGKTATLQGVFALELFKYLVYADSSWRHVGYDLARAGGDGAKVDAILSATDLDLSAFRARGGKLLLAHGWSDPALNPRATIEYFKAVQQHTPDAGSFVRLFLLPGVLHCDGGSGCDDVEYAAVIRAWVEQGEAPSRIVARKLQDSQVVRTHPLCAYPKTAQYNGSGNTDEAASFSCR